MAAVPLPPVGARVLGESEPCPHSSSVCEWEDSARSFLSLLPCQRSRCGPKHVSAARDKVELWGGGGGAPRPQSDTIPLMTEQSL